MSPHNNSYLKNEIPARVITAAAMGFTAFFFIGNLFFALVISCAEIVFGFAASFLVRSVLQNRAGKRNRGNDSFVLWFTGLSGAGKSTLANKLYGYLTARGFAVERLDGDTVRSIFPNTGFTRDERDNHVKRVGYIASMLEKNGVIVLSSFISPYRESRLAVRNMCRNFVEIYIATSLDECRKRDVKGLYEKVGRGEIKNFTGIDDPYEEPLNPEIVVETDGKPLQESFDHLIREIQRVTGIHITG